MEKPRTILDYRRWLDLEHKIIISERDSNYYHSVATNIMRDFEASKFWVSLLDNLTKYDQEYRVQTGYVLFARSQFRPILETKSFESFLEKTYRKNVLENDLWPTEPQKGWITPENWFSEIKDTVRTLFVVRYFDGVDFLIKKIVSLCKKYDLPLEIDYEAREEGYYAAHLYVKQEFEVPSETWDTKRIFAFIELQITTQLQEVIRKLLHNYYEKKRMMVRKPTEKWQWDYKCDEFCVNYLGHILHYVEGMIMEVRERQKGELK
jgi:hypothetical protein